MSVPVEVQKSHSDQLKETKLLLRDVKKTYRAQVLRLEKLMCEGRDLPYDIWQEHYRDHPIVGALARRLLWRFGTELVHLGQNSANSDNRVPTTLDGRSVVGCSGINIRL